MLKSSDRRRLTGSIEAAKQADSPHDVAALIKIAVLEWMAYGANVDTLLDDLVPVLDEIKRIARHATQRIAEAHEQIAEAHEATQKALQDAVEAEEYALRAARQAEEHAGQAVAAIVSAVTDTDRFDREGYFVYLLWGGDLTTPVYVGSSRNVLSRLGQHTYDPIMRHRFVSAQLVRCSGPVGMLVTEQRLIAHYNPPLNTVGRTSWTTTT